MNIKYKIFFFLFLFGVFAPVSAQSDSARLASAVPPENPELVRGINDALSGDVEAAEKAFAEDMKKRPGSRPGGIDAAMAFADPSFEFKHFGKLRFWLEKTAEDYPADPEAFLLLADIALSDGRYLECSMLANHAAGLVEKFDANPDRKNSLRLYYEKLFANVAEQKERWEDAAKHSARLHELEPDNGEHLYRLGLAQYRLGSKDKAIESLIAAVAKDDRIPPALIVLAQLAEYDGKSEDARKLVAEALEKQGDNPSVLLAAADLELKWNHLANVSTLAGKVKQLEPTSLDAEMLLGIVDLYGEKYKDAEEKFMKILESLPDNSRAMTGAALALCELPEPRQIRRAFSLAKLNADKNPDSIDAQVTLAWVLFKAESADEAEKILMRQFDAGDLNSPGAYYLAVLFSKQKRNDEAIRFLETALERNVNFPKKAAAEKLLKELTEEEKKKGQ